MDMEFDPSSVLGEIAVKYIIWPVAWMVASIREFFGIEKKVSWRLEDLPECELEPLPDDPKK